MKADRLTRKLVIAALLLSLLFHTSFILYSLLQQDKAPEQSHIQTKQEELKQEIEKEQRWAETKARVGNFGAPVLFQDRPTLPEQKNLPQSPEQVDTPLTDTDFNASETAAAEKPTTQESTIEEKLYPAEKNTSHRRSRKKKRDIDYVKRRQQEQAMQQQNKQASPMTKIAEATAPITPKKLPTLAQLTQGFLYQQKDKGTHTVHMLGDKKKLPTDEQIKCERYIEKLNWCIQNIFNIHNNQIDVAHCIKSKAQILLALNKDGSIRKLALVESSGNRIIDQFLMFAFKEASSSFPPVPHYLPHDPFSIVYIMSTAPF